MITLGAAGGVAATQTQPDFNLGGFVPPVSATTPATPSTPPAAAGLPPQVTSAVPPVAPPVVASRPGVFRILLDAFSLRTLYAALALGTVMMFLGWRGLLALRILRRGAQPSAGSGG
jgi:hypothetical protein